MKLYKHITVEMVKELLEEHPGMSRTEVAQHFNVWPKHFLAAIRSSKAGKELIPLFEVSGRGKANTLKFKCICCGKESSKAIDKAFRVADYSKRCLCSNCKQKTDEIFGNFMLKLNVYHGIPHHDTVEDGRVLEGEEFELAAAECTPILDIKNRAEKPKFVDFQNWEA